MGSYGLHRPTQLSSHIHHHRHHDHAITFGAPPRSHIPNFKEESDEADAIKRTFRDIIQDNARDSSFLASYVTITPGELMGAEVDGHGEVQWFSCLMGDGAHPASSPHTANG